MRRLDRVEVQFKKKKKNVKMKKCEHAVAAPTASVAVSGTPHGYRMIEGSEINSALTGLYVWGDAMKQLRA